ncbi:MAG: diguanylate cyclase [Polyangiaceae bacterium]
MESSVAIRDSLTGAYSRAMFDERLPDEVERARRYGTPLCLLVFDVDYFKSVNDAFGHSRGDAVLRELVQRVQAAIRSSDILFRYGGDEFVVVLPNTARASGTSVALRVLEAVTSGPFLGHPPLSVSVSLGLAVFPEDAQAARPLFETADHRSFQAKRNGRGCLVGEGLKSPSDIPLQECSRLIERDAALGEAHRLLDRVREPSRSILRVSGSAGAGKTRFLSEVAAAARLRNLLVLQLRGSRGAKVRPFGVWIESAPTSWPLPEAGRPDVLAHALEGARMAHGHTGTVIACDDLSDFDFSTFELIASLLTNAVVRHLVVVFTTGPRSARSFVGPPDASHEDVELLPLSADGTLIWLRSTMQWEAPRAFVDWLHEASGGAPGKLLQGVLLLRERGVLHRTGAFEWFLEPGYASTPLARKLRGPSSLADPALPPALTDFVGREVEQARINALLDRSRLVSLVGPGGIGKTRLSMQIGRARADDFADGVRFVALASTLDPALVPSAIAISLGVRQAAGKTIRDSLLKSLRDKEMLLVLDNFEHIVAAAPFVSEMMTGAPGLRVLVTSREPLRISGEHVYPVPTLPLPRASESLSTEEALQSPAVALFVMRAQASTFGFALTADNAQQVVELCRRLDGLPLAIEIAAARTDHVSPGAMLDANAGLLGAEGPRDLPLRQQTLHNVIDWSYSMLESAAACLFRRFAVFAGSASLEAIVETCGGGEVEGKLGRLLASLVDKSLLVADMQEGREGRYHLLGTIRAFASKELAKSREEAAIRDRHAAHFSKLAAQLSAILAGSQQRATLDRFEIDYPNFRATLTHLRVSAPGTAAALALALGRFWEKRGHWAEGLDWLDDLASLAETDASLRGPCLQVAGRLARLQSDDGAAVTRLRAAKELAEARGDANLLALVNFDLGCAALLLESDYVSARSLLTQSLVLFRKVRDETGAAEALGKLGLLDYYQADHARAEERCNEALTLARRRGDPVLASSVLHVLGLVARARGDYATAAALLEEHLRTCEWLDDKYGMMDACWNLAEFARSRGEFDRASTMYQRYMAFCHEVGNAAGTASAVKDLGEVARYRGEYDEAALLYERALRLLKASGYVGDIPWVERNQAEIAMHRAELEQARLLYQRSLGHHGADTHPMLLLLCIAGLAAIAAERGHFDAAARLAGAAERLFEADGALLAVVDRADYERRIDRVKERAGSRAFGVGRTAGRAMSATEVVALATAVG